MIRNVRSVLFALIIAIGLAGCGSGDSQNADTVDTTEHDNWVYFDPWKDNIPLAYAQDDHSITSGQPWGGVSTGKPDLDWGIDVKAGRKGSSGPAAWFRSNASAATCTADCNTDWPSDLNFAIKGTSSLPWPAGRSGNRRRRASAALLCSAGRWAYARSCCKAGRCPCATDAAPRGGSRDR